MEPASSAAKVPPLPSSRTMPQTRRSLARSLLLGSGVLGTLPRSAAAAPPLPVAPAGTDMRGYLQRTRAALPAANARARQAVDRSLERMDDLAIDPAAGRMILVNIAAAELIAYEEGREVMRSRVVVGAEKTRTPQLGTFVTSARLNPPWYVPASIEKEVRAAGISGFNVVNGRLIQPPGPNNPLGPIRIGLYDSDGIFLHGTTSPGLFARPARALSHGCVRVERIREVAAWLLDQTPAAVATRLATNRTLELLPTQEVQVALAYLTAWPDAGGRLALYGDPYGLDAGGRRAPYRRVSRPVPKPPAEAAAEAAAEKPEDNPL